MGEGGPGRSLPRLCPPKRVNNEVLDDFRTTYYDELSALVDTMTMEQAVLALNRWAHKHITYQPRTVAPPARLPRCGMPSAAV